MRRTTRRDNIALIVSPFEKASDKLGCLDFLIDQLAGNPLNIAKTICFIDNKNEIQLPAKYLRAKLRVALGPKATVDLLVSCYTGTHRA